MVLGELVHLNHAYLALATPDDEVRHAEIHHKGNELKLDGCHWFRVTNSPKDQILVLADGEDDHLVLEGDEFHGCKPWMLCDVRDLAAGELDGFHLPAPHSHYEHGTVIGPLDVEYWSSEVEGFNIVQRCIGAILSNLVDSNIACPIACREDVGSFDLHPLYGLHRV